MITEWGAGGNGFAVNGRIWGVNGRGKAIGWGILSPTLGGVGASFGQGSTGSVLSLALSGLKGYPTWVLWSVNFDREGAICGT
jgi:hypothetical protein